MCVLKSSHVLSMPSTLKSAQLPPLLCFSIASHEGCVVPSDGICADIAPTVLGFRFLGSLFLSSSSFASWTTWMTRPFCLHTFLPILPGSAWAFLRVNFSRQSVIIPSSGCTQHACTLKLYTHKPWSSFVFLLVNKLTLYWWRLCLKQHLHPHHLV